MASINKSHFDPDFHPQDFLAHCREGNTKTEICAAWGIVGGTLHRWVKNYPEMKKAFQLGADAHAAFWLSRSRQNILGERQKFNQFGFIWYSKNTMGWSDQGRNEFQGANSADEFVLHDQGTGKLLGADMKEMKEDEE